MNNKNIVDALSASQVSIKNILNQQAEVIMMRPVKPLQWWHPVFVWALRAVRAWRALWI